MKHFILKAMLALLPALAFSQTFNVPVPAQTVTGPVITSAIPITVPPQTVQATMTSAATTEPITINAPGCTVTQNAPTAFSVTACGSPLTGKAAIMAYLNGLKGQTKHLVIGQHLDYWAGNNLQQTLTQLNAQTGKNPAIVGVQIDIGSFSPLGIPGNGLYGVTLANQYLANGQIVMISEAPFAPSSACPGMWAGNTGTTTSSCSAAVNTSLPAQNFANITIKGTTEYNNFQVYLSQLAGVLKQINGPILFRPYYEQNGWWFWWGNENPAQFIAMWKMEHDYLTAQGLTNLIWVYASNGGVGNYGNYFPGAGYADIAALDCYPPTTQFDPAAMAAFSAFNLPIIYAEMGPANPQGFPQNAYDDSAVVKMVEQNFPNVVGVVEWGQSSAFWYQRGAAAVAADPQTIWLSDLPKFN